MTDSEITALAREYAEFTDMSPVDKKNISAICECFLKYTLRRYALVEKEGVHKWTGVKLRLPEIDQRVLICERVANQYKIFIGRRIALSNGGWGWNQSIKESVVAWMPLPKYPHALGKEEES